MHDRPTSREILVTASQTEMSLTRGGRPRPDGPLIRSRRAHSSVHEFLQPLTFPGLGCVQVAFGINGNTVHAIELAGLPSAVTETRDILQRLAIDNVDLVVHPVRHEDVFLLRIFR